MPLATTVGHIVIGLVLIGGLLALATICAMKGKWVFFVLGWFNGIFWIVGACRLGKPKSFWATRRYGERAMARAQWRFSRKLIPHWGDPPYRTWSDPRDEDLGRMY